MIQPITPASLENFFGFENALLFEKLNKMSYIFQVLIAFFSLFHFFIYHNHPWPSRYFDLEERMIIPPWLWEFLSPGSLYEALFESLIFGYSLSGALWSDECLALPHPQNVPAAAALLALERLALNMFLVNRTGNLVFFSFIHSSEYECLTSCKPSSLYKKK